jgi:hypothetical protein
VLQETITANVSDDSVTLEFQRSDGTLITQLVDFRNVSTSTFSTMLSTLIFSRYASYCVSYDKVYQESVCIEQRF